MLTHIVLHHGATNYSWATWISLLRYDTENYIPYVLIVRSLALKVLNAFTITHTLTGLFDKVYGC